MASDHQRLLRALQKHPEFEVTPTKKRHWKVTRDGRFVTMLAHTPSDRRGLKNALARLRREGFER